MTRIQSELFYENADDTLEPLPGDVFAAIVEAIRLAALRATFFTFLYATLHLYYER
jgi:hypothetical protein